MGWLVDFEKPLYLIAPSDKIKEILGQLRAVGIDNVVRLFYMLTVVDGHHQTINQISPYRNLCSTRVCMDFGCPQPRRIR